MRVTARHGNLPLNNQGHYAHNSLVHKSKESTTLGQSSDLLQGDWRKRHNAKPVVVIETEVDTTGCL